MLYGKVDAILLTGGMAHSEYITSRLQERVSFLAPVHVYPGEDNTTEKMKRSSLNSHAIEKMMNTVVQQLREPLPETLSPAILAEDVYKRQPKKRVSK